MTIILLLERRVIFNPVYSEYATEEDALQRGEAANPRGTSMKLLHIDSSILGQHSASRELGAAIVARWQRDVRGLEVAYRDLAANPLPHLSGGSLIVEVGSSGNTLQEARAAVRLFGAAIAPALCELVGE